MTLYDDPNRDWQRADFFYELPSHLIAQTPLPVRSASRLLVLERGGSVRALTTMQDFPNWLRAGDLLIFNDTKVLPARFWLRRASGGRHEMLFERALFDWTFLAQLRGSKALREGEVLSLDGEPNLRFHLVEKKSDGLHCLEAQWQGEPEAAPASLEAMCARYGTLPLPTYIERAPTAEDAERYQTIFARVPGAVAAPTAGLHFDLPLVERLKAAGIEIAFVTLHVGSGTFTPVRVTEIAKHKMHAERFFLSQETLGKIKETKERGGRVIAVGTTVLRTLEGAYQQGWRAGAGETEIFIRPGFLFQVVDGLFTNFHLPESTLLMLVAAFAGYAPTMTAYQMAITAGFRFYSYGDAMVILPTANAARQD